MCHSTQSTRCTTCHRRSSCNHRRNCPARYDMPQIQEGNSHVLPPAYGTMQPVGEKLVDEGMVGERVERRRGGCCGRRGGAGAGYGYGYGYGGKRCRGPVRALVGYLIQRHMGKKEQKERGLSGVGVGFDGVGMGRTQEVGVVEDEGLDEKYMVRDGGEVKDEFEKDVKVLERSVRSLEL
ncbi:hypothetical protein JMJ35_004906 [Cladonia borealis]|uniref:Uncharacterized protein n=1 Tax=Cladonia borealis TaxID=184061 RepID=A0AA39R316_9LECA|nr:hypothetical protein JMJ35_004906 [Cladonia borealis]